MANDSAEMNGEQGSGFGSWRAISPLTRAIGIDLGGTSIKAVALTPEGQTLARTNLSFEAEKEMVWSNKIRDLVHQLRTQTGLTKADASSPLPDSSVVIGISATGLAATDRRSIYHMPGRLKGLEGLDWTQFLAADRAVPVMNDAQAALLGESWLGAARGFQNVFLLTLGTGVGGAAMVDGNLLRGHLGRAGHLGHICLDPNGPPDLIGTPGALEDAIGNCTISARSSGRFQTTHELVAAHRSGDRDATAIWLKSLRELACGIVSLINVLDPEAVIIGGGIAQAGPVLFEPLQRFIDPIEWRPAGRNVKILPAQLGEFAGACGAARMALGQTGAASWSSP
jgi:glucokinase